MGLKCKKIIHITIFFIHIVVDKDTADRQTLQDVDSPDLEAGSVNIDAVGSELQ